MINSYADFLKVVPTLRLADTNVPACHYLEGSTKDVDPEGRYVFLLTGEHFEHAFQNPAFSKEKNPFPTWMQEHFLDIVATFTVLDAYGSVMGLLEFFARNQIPEQTVIDMIRRDKTAAEPILDQKAYNFLLLAAAYCSSPPLMMFLLNECKADINFQATGFRITPPMYAAKYCTRETFKALIDHGLKTGTIDLNLKDKWGTTLLGSAANGLYFGRGRGEPQERIDEFAYLLENGACPMDHFALYEAMRTTGFSFEAGLTMLQQGAGLIKPDLRAISNEQEGWSTEQYKSWAAQEFSRWKTVAGFDMDAYLSAEIVVVGINKRTKAQVFLYSVEQVSSALADSNIEIDCARIRKHLSKADPNEVNAQALQLFMAMPEASLVVTPFTKAQVVKADAKPATQPVIAVPRPRTVTHSGLHIHLGLTIAQILTARKAEFPKLSTNFNHDELAAVINSSCERFYSSAHSQTSVEENIKVALIVEGLCRAGKCITMQGALVILGQMEVMGDHNIVAASFVGDPQAWDYLPEDIITPDTVARTIVAAHHGYVSIGSGTDEEPRIRIRCLNPNGMRSVDQLIHNALYPNAAPLVQTALPVAQVVREEAPAMTSSQAPSGGKRMPPPSAPPAPYVPTQAAAPQRTLGQILEQSAPAAVDTLLNFGGPDFS